MMDKMKEIKSMIAQNLIVNHTASLCNLESNQTQNGETKLPTPMEIVSKQQDAHINYLNKQMMEDPFVQNMENNGKLDVYNPVNNKELM